MDKWDRRFMQLATLASTWSKDSDVKVGAAVRGTDNTVLGLGFNGFPPMIEDRPEWLADKETKRLLMVHAEVNAILNMAAVGDSGTLYVTRPPCVECAKFIVASKRIRTVYCPTLSVDSSWHQSCKQGEWLLAKAGIWSHWLTEGEWENASGDGSQ